MIYIKIIHQIIGAVCNFVKILYDYLKIYYIIIKTYIMPKFFNITDRKIKPFFSNMLESKISKNKAENARNESKNLLVVSLQCFHFHRNKNKVSKHTKLGIGVLKC